MRKIYIGYITLRASPPAAGPLFEAMGAQYLGGITIVNLDGIAFLYEWGGTIANFFKVSGGVTIANFLYRFFKSKSLRPTPPPCPLRFLNSVLRMVKIQVCRLQAKRLSSEEQDEIMLFLLWLLGACSCCLCAC